jgi:hypothetical protein
MAEFRIVNEFCCCEKSMCTESTDGDYRATRITLKNSSQSILVS